MPTKYFPKDDIIALAGQIVPEGYELLELKLSWDDGKGTSVVFRVGGRFYQFSGWNGGGRPKGLLANWEGDVPAYEVYWDEGNFKWKELRDEN